MVENCCISNTAGYIVDVNQAPIVDGSPVMQAYSQDCIFSGGSHKKCSKKCSKKCNRSRHNMKRKSRRNMKRKSRRNMKRKSRRNMGHKSRHKSRRKSTRKSYN